MEITHVCPADSKKSHKNISQKHYAEYRQKVPRYHQKYDTIHTEIPFPRKDCSRPAGRAAGEYPHKLRHALHQHPPLPLSIIHYIKSKNTW